jgi:hypothetical protein
VQSFLYLNPNIVGDPTTGSSSSGARSYGATYIQDWPALHRRHLRQHHEFGARPRRHLRGQGAVELLQRRIRRARRRDRHHPPRDQRVLGQRASSTSTTTA